MCLTCYSKHNTIKGKEEISKVFDWSGILDFFRKSNNDNSISEEDLRNLSPIKTKNTLHTHNNEVIELNLHQIKEIINNASGIIVTGIDMTVDIWAIQWPRNYKVQSFK